jgi:hypothetical protein
MLSMSSAFGSLVALAHPVKAKTTVTDKAIAASTDTSMWIPRFPNR